MPKQNSCSAAVQEKITLLRELMHEVVSHPEVTGNRDCAIEVKTHIARNLGVLNATHGFASNSKNNKPARKIFTEPMK